MLFWNCGLLADLGKDKYCEQLECLDNFESSFCKIFPDLAKQGHTMVNLRLCETLVLIKIREYNSIVSIIFETET